MRRDGKRDRGQLVVAIPAHDEVERIVDCLTALDRQEGARLDHIVLFVNNATDGTAAAARGVPMQTGTYLHVLEQWLPPAQANAGFARRTAMQAAAVLAGPNGVLFTTDADGVVDPTWVAANLAAMAAGADAVAGWVDLDPMDWSAIPLRLHTDDAQECAYDALCDEIHARLDPDPDDPLPRHTQHSGASIAVTVKAYHQAGGIPQIASGEDRAFLAALRAVDARIRHAPECHVMVSGRIVGRATGGMADTIRRRMIMPDSFLDDRLEPAEDCARRATLRRRLRQCFTHPALARSFADDVHLEPGFIAALLKSRTFGAVWAAVEARSPILRRRPVAVADLPAEMARAQNICAVLREPAPSTVFATAV